MADPHTRRYAVCARCEQSVYLNAHPQRSVDVWVHTLTGSKHCGDEGGIADPAAA